MVSKLYLLRHCTISSHSSMDLLYFWQQNSFTHFISRKKGRYPPYYSIINNDSWRRTRFFWIADILMLHHIFSQLMICLFCFHLRMMRVEVPEVYSHCIIVIFQRNIHFTFNLTVCTRLMFLSYKMYHQYIIIGEFN